MYFTFYTSFPDASPPSSGDAGDEVNPLLPLPPTTKTDSVQLHPASPAALLTAGALQVAAYTLLRYTSSVRGVPAESLLILLALPCLIVPAVHAPTRARLAAIPPHSSARILALAIFLSLSLYSSISSLVAVPASLALSLLSLAPLFALGLSAVVLRARRGVSPTAIFTALLLLPCALAVLAHAPAPTPARVAALLGAPALAAFCLLAFDAMDVTVVCVATSACCGALALVFADRVALRMAFSVAAFNSATIMAAFVLALIRVAKLAPHCSAILPGVTAPVVAVLASLLLREVPSLSAGFGLVAGGVVSVTLANMRAVQLGFRGGANMLFAPTKGAVNSPTVLAM